MAKEDFAKGIQEMDVLELSELIAEMEVKFGVSAAAAAVAVGHINDDVEIQSADKFVSLFLDVTADPPPEHRLEAIRYVTGLSLKEAANVLLLDNHRVVEKISLIEAKSVVDRYPDVFTIESEKYIKFESDRVSSSNQQLDSRNNLKHAARKLEYFKKFLSKQVAQIAELKRENAALKKRNDAYENSELSINDPELKALRDQMYASSSRATKKLDNSLERANKTLIKLNELNNELV